MSLQFSRYLYATQHNDDDIVDIRYVMRAFHNRSDKSKLHTGFTTRVSSKKTAIENGNCNAQRMESIASTVEHVVSRQNESRSRMSQIRHSKENTRFDRGGGVILFRMNISFTHKTNWFSPYLSLSWPRIKQIGTADFSLENTGDGNSCSRIQIEKILL